MPTTKSKRDLVLKSSFEGSVDQSEALADGVLLRGRRGDERLAATSDENWWIEGRGRAELILGAGGDDLLVAGRVRLGDAGTDRDPDRDDAVGVFDPGFRGGVGVIIDGGGGNDLVVGGRGNDLLIGGTGNDSLWGFQGDDALIGGEGDDVLAPGLGGATLEGGEGIDTVSWADLTYTNNPGGLAGVVLNLSDRLIRYDSGDQIGEGRILVQDASGGFVVLGEADTVRTRAALRLEGEIELDISAGTASPVLLPAVQKLKCNGGLCADGDVERFEGTLGLTDVAVLADGFAFVGMGADGFQQWSDGTRTLAFREFEVILIA